MQTIKLNIAAAVSYFLVSYATEWWAETLAVWPAAGLALAGLMIFGKRIWPGLWIGAFASALTHFSPAEYSASPYVFIVPFLAACGNTAAALLANRVSPAQFFDHENDEEFHKKAGRYLSAVLILGIISSLVGISSYTLLYQPVSSGFWLSMIGWLTADVAGVITFTPFLYLLYRHRFQSLQRLLSPEGLAILLIITLIGYFVYGPGYQQEIYVFLQPSLIFIPLLWAVLRKPQLPLAFLNLFFFLLAWWGTASGYGYFSHFFDRGSLTAMQVMLCSSLLSIQMLELLLAQRRHELLQQHEKLKQTVKARTLELEQAKQAAESLARTDVMTGLNNRRAFFEFGSLIEKNSKRNQHYFSVLMIDIDKFKQVNDQFGHDIGDITIISLAQCIKETVRDSDIAARIGGEEFAVILPESSVENALEYATRIQQRIAQERITTPQRSFTYTVSIGIAAFKNMSDTLNSVLKRSDDALYQAKSDGRNCIRSIPSTH